MSKTKKLVAWVTGSQSGIGAAISRDLKSSGFSVRELTRADFDLADGISVNKWVQGNTETPFLIVCNAGVNQPTNISEFSPEGYDETLRSNYSGHMQLCLSAIPRLSKNGGGRIVFISSAYSQRARKGRFAYSASKASIDALMRSIAVEFAEFGILANSVAPGFIETKLTIKNNNESAVAKILERVPLMRLGQPAEVAKLVSFLGSPENTFITGQVVNIDGGFSIT